MPKYKNRTSAETIEEAKKIAKSTQRPSQSKEQTKLIAQGIQKGIEQYKKQYKSKARELDKKIKSFKNVKSETSLDIKQNNGKREKNSYAMDSFISLLPWALLIFSWIGFIAYIQQ
ncbi:MAG: DUF2956 domain-containing protein [Kangiellaceae bacterium]|nr:DUF2956 domain-containing protein [Kangiellaceae bacterium]